MSPCCAGLDQVAGHRFGNVFERPLPEIVADLDRSPLVRMLVFRGVQAVIALLQEAGVEVKGEYTSICHQCWSIFSDPTLVRELDLAMTKRRAEGIRAVIERLQLSASGRLQKQERG